MIEHGKGKGTTAADRRVGSRIRLRRKMVGMTQVSLGSQLGVTSQQVQKYERGLNRIGASRLERIAQALGVPTSHFFGEDGGLPTQHGEVLDQFLQLPESAALISAFMTIDDPIVRRRAVEFVQSIKILADAIKAAPDSHDAADMVQVSADGE